MNSFGWKVNTKLTLFNLKIWWESLLNQQKGVENQFKFEDFAAKETWIHKNIRNFPKL